MRTLDSVRVSAALALLGAFFTVGCASDEVAEPTAADDASLIAEGGSDGCGTDDSCPADVAGEADEADEADDSDDGAMDDDREHGEDEEEEDEEEEDVAHPDVPIDECVDPVPPTDDGQPDQGEACGARLEGTFDVLRTITVAEGYDPADPDFAVGNVAPRTYIFAPHCESGACHVDLSIQTVDGDEIVTTEVVGEYSGGECGVYEAHFDITDECTAAHFDYLFYPIASSVTESGEMATEFEGSAVYRAEPVADCGYDQYQEVTFAGVLAE